VLEEVTALNLVLIGGDGLSVEAYTGPFGPDPPVRNTVLVTDGLGVHKLDGFDELDEVLHFLRKLCVLRRTFVGWDQSTESV